MTKTTQIGHMNHLGSCVMWPKVVAPRGAPECWDTDRMPNPTMPKLSRADCFLCSNPYSNIFPIPNGSMTCICKPPPGMLFNMFEYQLDYCSHCLLNLWSLLTSNSDFCNLIPIYRGIPLKSNFHLLGNTLSLLYSYFYAHFCLGYVQF